MFESPIAFCEVTSKLRRMKPVCLPVFALLAAVASLAGSALRADDAIPAPPPPPKGERPPQDGQGYRPGPPHGGMMPGAPGMMRGEREHMDAFNQLPEEERKRVREAFEKVWNKAEVISARDRLMKANEDYRQELHNALEQVDPGVVKIIEKTKPPMPGGFPFVGRLPDPNDPEFSKKVQARLREDIQNWARNEKRDASMGRFHERLASPAVRDLVQQLDAAQEPQRRLEAAGRLREAYLAAWRTEFGQPREGQPRREGPPQGRPERRDNASPPDNAKK
ncbi:MAG TPA: hypothetical protein VGH65_01360 [Verrucomicrobiaceae bacterium]